MAVVHERATIRRSQGPSPTTLVTVMSTLGFIGLIALEDVLGSAALVGGGIALLLATLGAYWLVER